ncbi:MAG: arginase family protein [Candidatus Heimdallarchaeota archaeon]|nr:arginase family protein [Candidatus Heimdallarchaeota archaeon]
MEFDDNAYGSFGGLVYEGVPIDEAHLIIVGAEYESATSGKKGASFAPSQLRLASKDMQTISRGGIDLNQVVITDVGNIPLYPIEGGKTRQSIEDGIGHLLNGSSAPILFIGGDHSCTFPSIKALAEKGTVGVIWFDAHRDLLPEALGSRFSHGSPLGRAVELHNVDHENILLVGTRYMESSEQEIIDTTSINELRMVDLEDSNFDMEQFQDKINEIADRVDFLYLSIDIDVLDPAYAPGTGTPVGGGLTTSQLMRYIAAIPKKLRIVDLMEVAPPLDHLGITIKACLGLITEIIGILSSHD